MNYREFEDTIYEQLKQWRTAYGWHFSMRKNASTGSERDRFIGTYKNSYAGTTFWKIKAGYPGSSSDTINLMCTLEGGEYDYKFELRHTRSPEDHQNQLVLRFLERLSESEGPPFDRIQRTPSDRKHLVDVIRSPQRKYSEWETFFEDLRQDLAGFIPLVDAVLEDFCTEYPEFEAARLTAEDSKLFENKYEERLAKHGRTRLPGDNGSKSFVPLGRKTWERLLRDQEVFEPDDVVLLKVIYQSPDRENNAKAIDALIKGLPFNEGENVRVNGAVSRLGKRIGKALREEHDLVFPENNEGRDVYWPLFFTGRTRDGLFFWKLRPELVAAMESVLDFSRQIRRLANASPLNQIFYGPPGTGKTYATITHAVAIVENVAVATVEEEERSEVLRRYRRYQQERRIAFTTFHQSLSYEDFVEGLKPRINKDSEEEAGEVEYEIKQGIFRDATTTAIYSAVEVSEADEERTALNFAEKYDAFVKMVQMNLAAEEPVELKTWTGKKVYIRELSEKKSMWIYHGTDGETKHTVSRQRLIKLNNKIKEKGEINNINKFIPEAIGGANYSAYYAAWKAVQDFVPSIETAQKDEYSSVDEKADIISGLDLSELNFDVAPAHVLIIDEINRGNVSAILGELITLLEPDKRLGAREELRVTLPYSREEFGVPPNLYVIGTMNTADRSVEALDAALRRRFTFREVAPDPQVITREHATSGQVQVSDLDVDLGELLQLINRRIKVLKDADHQIGHSYFLRVRDWRGLATAFNDRIIPLLREYFFANYGQLQLVVGKGFCAVEATETTDFAIADDEVEDYGRDYRSYHFPAPNTEGELADALRQLGLS
ncbi:McrB family protein [Lewinella sp. W8]|uniref:McrB family protein n=1 Tax=Lewinella sp. W8 TaxID=2528208 RepID=UPI0010682414|nr:AAA family ATPase [Lewinella sp. W8]MTB51859.1 AAA domain-containing protein [Lewinella sp. W8]